jgi:hypothetical protein
VLSLSALRVVRGKGPRIGKSTVNEPA